MLWMPALCLQLCQLTRQRRAFASLLVGESKVLLMYLGGIPASHAWAGQFGNIALQRFNCWSLWVRASNHPSICPPRGSSYRQQFQATFADHPEGDFRCPLAMNLRSLALCPKQTLT